MCTENCTAVFSGAGFFQLCKGKRKVKTIAGAVLVENKSKGSSAEKNMISSHLTATNLEKLTAGNPKDPSDVSS